MTSTKQTPPYMTGQPFYCAVCGAGYGEYIACEDVKCELETKEVAERRRENWLSENAKADAEGGRNG